ncbi:CvpA family protein [Candidatus Stoquefichus massiliensis]|uniref:CvpA family protein n=1 Tax=Candidatus Stoquefichus massiliensis TaxID=1470350 RepID=UPI0004B4B4C4|nr:CvpA family protein [Candidatus Stoquefichus massiliensis]
MNLHMIDIIFVIFFIFMAIIGYIKGFVTRLYDFIGMIVVLFLSYFLAKPLSSIIILYKYDATDVFASMIGQMINQIMIFIILLLVLMVIKKLLGLVIKPLLKGLMETFTLTSFVDKTLGLLLSCIESVMIAYLVLVFIVMPFVSEGTTLIQESLIASRIVKLVPDVSESMMDMTQYWKGNPTETIDSPETLTKLVLTAIDMNLIDTNQAEKILTDHVLESLEEKNISLTESQKQHIERILKESGYSQTQLENILKNINVSGE